MTTGKTSWQAFTRSLLIHIIELFLVVLLVEYAFCKRTSTRLESFRTCTRKNGAMIGGIVIQNGAIYKNKQLGILNADMNITRNLAHSLPAEIVVSKCSGSSARECVALLKYRRDDICMILTSKVSLWNAFTDKIDPRVVCPIKEGLHRVKNATFDGAKFSSYFQAVPGEQAKVTYFVIKMHSKVDGVDMICLEIMFRLLTT